MFDGPWLRSLNLSFWLSSLVIQSASLHAQNAENVYELLDALINSYLPKAKEEVAQVAQKAKGLEGDDFVMQPWDFSYYSQKLKHELYDYDPDMLRPYLELSHVQKGVLALATKLYGITFKENKHIPVTPPTS